VGTVPVGAVIVNESGDVVGRGRNRIFDGRFDGQLASSRLAHAEVNVLVQLASDRTYEDLQLYTALEPCHLCLSAAIAVRIGTLHYASVDRYGGAIGKLVPSRDHLVHPIQIEGPLGGIAGRLPELLLVAHILWRRPDGDVAQFYREIDEETIATARRLPPPKSGATLADAISAIT
jgi:tRNA(Arg) A34 adenosine deaminase TadA